MNIVASLEIYLKKVIRKEKKGPFPFLLKSILLVMSWGFSSIIFLRNRAYDQGWIKRYYPPVPVVISIGNIVAGGTGKTPVTHLLAKQLCHQHTIGILSRGYRAPFEKFSEPVMLSQGKGPLFPAALCGDEPYLLAKNLDGVWIFVGPNRRKSSHMAARAGVQILLLDDGMQHRQVARDFDIVVINAQDPLGMGYFLPRGFLRDHLKSLSRASLIILNHVNHQEHYAGVKKRLSKHTKAPMIGTSLIPTHYCDFKGNVLHSIAGKRVGLFCGIGEPENFRRLVKQQGAEILGEYLIPDHLAPSKASLLSFADQCAKKGADFLLCTEKDGVKLSEGWEGVLPIYWMKAELQLVVGEEHWHQFLEQVRNKVLQ